MMWFKPLKELPDELFDLSRVRATPVQRISLRARSRHLYALGEGRELMFVLGVLPPTPLSLTACLWFLVVEGVRPTLAQLRQMRLAFTDWRKQAGYLTLLADVAPGRDTRFAKFFGGQLIGPRTMEWS